MSNVYDKNGDLILNSHPMGDEDQEALESVIEEGNRLLELDRVEPEDFLPRNALVTVRRLGKLVDDKIGSIVMPISSNKFDVAEIINVGPGTAGDHGINSDTHDLERGQLVLIKTEGSPQPGLRATTTLKFRMGDGEVELMNQFDILAIIQPRKENDNDED